MTCYSVSHPNPVRLGRCLSLALALVVAVGLGSACSQPEGDVPARFRSQSGPPIQDIVCIYEQAGIPLWMNVDMEGDRDPEGVQFCAYLIPDGHTRGSFRDGRFKIEMYHNIRDESGSIVRKLAGDYDYPTTQFTQIGRGGVMGQGYLIRLVFARKDMAGKDIDMIVSYEDPSGRVVRSAVKSLRVPGFAPVAPRR